MCYATWLRHTAVSQSEPPRSTAAIYHCEATLHALPITTDANAAARRLITAPLSGSTPLAGMASTLAASILYISNLCHGDA